MDRARLAPALLLLLLGTPGQAAPPAVPAAPALSPDEQALKAVHVPLDGPGLLGFLRQRTRVTVSPGEVAALLRELGDKVPAVQEKAFGNLVGLGALAVPALRVAANELTGAETPARARRCLQVIEGQPAAPLTGAQAVSYIQGPYGFVATAANPGLSGAGVPAAAVRLVALRRPPGATEALLAYLPCANDDHVAREVEMTLAVVGFRNRQPDPALVKALTSPLALQRAVAAALLCRVDGAEQQAAVRPLLKDPRPSVRLRAAQGLADLNNADAIPVLLDLLTTAALPHRQAAEAYLHTLAGEWAITVPQGAGDLAARLRQDLWARWWAQVDGPALLEEFHKRTPTDADRERAAALIQQLDEESFAVREKAATELMALGGPAVPLLLRAVRQNGPRTGPYAARCLGQIEMGRFGPLPAAAIRLLMLRRPRGAPEALLAYLPCAESSAVEAQLQAALSHLALHSGRPDFALVRGLEDRCSQRRAAAAEVLCKAGPTDQLPAVRRLLQDADPEVRRRVALALAAARDKEAVPVLITLLGELPVEQAVQVEEFLSRLAGTQAPPPRWDGQAATRGPCRTAWAAWWRDHGRNLDLTRHENLDWLFGHTLIIESGDNTTQRLGRVFEIDHQGGVRWQIEGLLAPVDAQVLPEGRVLVAELGANRVSERDLQGTILWQRAVSLPLACQRLPNGHTFLVGRSQLVELDKAGNEVFVRARQQADILSARKLADGRTVLVTQGMNCTHLDAAGKEGTPFRLSNLQYAYGNIEVLPNGGFLVPQAWLNKVVELNTEGQFAGEFNVPQPVTASRLTNGHTLVVSQQYPMRVLELDRDSRVVWEWRDSARPSRAAAPLTVSSTVLGKNFPMPSRIAALLLAALTAAPAEAAEPPATLAAELALKAAGLATDGPALQAFFRTRMQPDADPETLRVLVRQLEDPSAWTREKALGELVARGTVAVPLLRQAARDADNGALARRARHGLQLIEGTPSPAAAGAPSVGPPGYVQPAAGYSSYYTPAAGGTSGLPASGSQVPIAAVRLLALRNPAGAAETLLAYLPHADNEAVGDEVKAALVTLALPDGQPEPALVRGLEDKVALRRVVAAEVLCQAAHAEPRGALRNLLRDPQPLVRLRLALVLADLKEAEAIATLIALLTDLPPSEVGLAEDYLLTLAGEQAPRVPAGTEAGVRQRGRDAWAAWWAAHDGAGLLQEFRKRSLKDGERGRAQTLVKQLGDDSFLVREKATNELKGMGSGIVPLLRQAVASPDLEVSQRAQKVLQVVEKEKLAPLAAVNARLVAYRKPAGAAEVLLGYLPLAEDDTVTVEVRAALAAVAVRDGQPEPVVVRALEDALPLRRAAAAEALCRAGAVGLRPVLRRLLQDKDRYVRQQAALALAGSGDREAVPTLLALLRDLQPEEAFAVEEFLLRMAGERAPSIRPGVDAAARARVCAAWEAWWHANSATVRQAELAGARLDVQRYLGYTLIVSQDTGTVLEVGHDGKPRWQLSGLQGPCDAQVLPNGRVLVTEMHGSRVTERNLKNEVVWEKRVNWPMGAQRLPNGNTFIVLRDQLLEVDRGGKETTLFPRPMQDILAAVKLRDGQIVCATTSQCLRLDAAGKELKSFRLQGPGRMQGLEVLPNGRVLLAQTFTNKVVEYDSDGKTVWEMTVPTPLSAARLPNGRVLVAMQQWPPKIVEMDRSGKVVWETQPPGQVARVKRR